MYKGVGQVVVMSEEVIRNFTDTEQYLNVDTLGLALSWEWLFQHQELSPSVRLTYAYLVSKVDQDTGGVSIPMETIARELGMAYATIWSYIKRLEESGYLRVERKISDMHTYYPVHTLLAA